MAYDSPEMLAAQAAAQARDRRLAGVDLVADPAGLSARMYPTMRKGAKPNRITARTAEMELSNSCSRRRGGRV